MKNFFKRVWIEIQAAFWYNVPYIIYSTVWLFLAMFWAMTFFKWYVKNFM